MKLETQPNKWSCTPTAIAMVLGMTHDDFVAELGHDGSEIIDHQQKDPLGRRGVNIHELVQLCWDLGYSMTPFDLGPEVINFEGQRPRKALADSEFRFIQHLKTGMGIIEGVRQSGTGHTVAFDHGRIYDPIGDYYNWTRLGEHNIKPYRLWRVCPQP